MCKVQKTDPQRLNPFEVFGAFLSCPFVYAVYKDEEQYLVDSKNLTSRDLTGFYATWPTGDYEMSPVSSKAVSIFNL